MNCSHCGNEDTVGPFEMDGMITGQYRPHGEYWIVCRSCNKSTHVETDTSELAAKVAPYHQSRQRIEVTSPCGETVRCYVGKTTGWRPSYLLMLKSNSTGSSILLNEQYQIVQ